MCLFHGVAILYLANLAAGEQPKIVIVGAGASGIAAASRLYENGFQDVTILEAEDRIGGRVFTTQFDGYWVDIGGEWVHGERNNIAFELASPLGLLEVPVGDSTRNVTLQYSDGTKISQPIGRAFLTIYNDARERAHEDLKGSNGSIGEYLESMITTAAICKTIPNVNETLVKDFIRLSGALENAENGAEDSYDASAKNLIASWHSPGNYMINWKGRGYGTILDILMKKIPNPEEELPVRNNTKLSSEVVNIDYKSREGKVSVELGNGDKYDADHVIFTPSLGVLKERYETLFTPALPESKVKTIKGLGMGNAGKMFISFEAPWWLFDNGSFVLMWTESDRREYENDEKKKWMLDVVDFAPVANMPKLLCGWLNGPGIQSMEALPEDLVFNQTVTLLHKFLGNSYNITKPTGFIRSSWCNNKYFQGSYSYRSMESEAADVWADDLAIPLLVKEKPVVMIAGEATHPRHFSTVHGAIESGFREANRLINFYTTTMKYHYIELVP